MRGRFFQRFALRCTPVPKMAVPQDHVARFGTNFDAAAGSENGFAGGVMERLRALAP